VKRRQLHGYRKRKTKEEDLKSLSLRKRKRREVEEEKACPTRKTTVQIGSFRAQARENLSD
jgi:hypothetical protein